MKWVIKNKKRKILEMKKQDNKGFTLVELVIVIAVIAILAVVLIGTFANVITRSNQSKAVQEIKAQVDEAYIEYVADEHVVPTTFYLEDDGKTVVFGMPTVVGTVYSHFQKKYQSHFIKVLMDQ